MKEAMKKLLMLGLLAANSFYAQGPTANAARPQKLSFELRLNGLNPTQLTIEEGTYSLELENHVFLAQVELQVDEAAGRRVAQTSTPPGKFQARKRQFVQLRPGTHVVQVVNQPNWKAIVTVVPKR